MTRKKIAVPRRIERQPEGTTTAHAIGGDYEYPSHHARSAVSRGQIAEPDNVVLEHLRAIRADVAAHGQRLGRIELRLSVMEQTLGSLYAVGGSDREAMQILARRVERIERRLDLKD